MLLVNWDGRVDNFGLNSLLVDYWLDGFMNYLRSISEQHCDKG